MPAEEIICTVCGFRNKPNLERCTACGAKLQPLGTVELSAEEEMARRHQQDTFEWKWVGVSVAIYLGLQAVILGILPLVIDQYDPQGLPGLLISAAVWFVGGIVVGVLSPGKTFIEPAVGALVAVVPTILFLAHIADVRQLSVAAYVVGGLLGVMVTLFGAFLGEKIQYSMG